jgi:Protein of unknown function (DUF3887)
VNGDSRRSDASVLAARLLDTARVVADDLHADGAGEPLNGAIAARELSRLSQDILRAAVDRARQRGHTWQEIGDILDTTRQAAFQRFGRPIDPRTGQPVASTVLPGATGRAVALITELTEQRWDQVRRDFTPTMATRLDAAGIAAAWAQTTGLVGSYEEIGEPLARALGDYTVVDVPLTFEAGEMVGRVSYDTAGQVAGLYILDPAAAGSTSSGRGPAPS